MELKSGYSPWSWKTNFYFHVVYIYLNFHVKWQNSLFDNAQIQTFVRNIL
jgi:hypothetical protein